MASIRKIRNTVYLHFDEWGDSFSLKVPHYNKWRTLITFLTKRGFKITENPSYKEHYSCLSKYHKIGYKNDVAVLMEIKPKQIEIRFGNIQNLWKGIAQSFWDDPSDERYTRLSYLEEVAVKLEIHRVIEFTSKWNMPLEVNDKDLSSEDRIINKLKNNTHIHGKVQCLEDIKNHIKEDSYDYKHNSNDKNGKKIICGDIKYFYDYSTKRLACGFVWHNINNMWWVIVGKELKNIASFELFDYSPRLPRRKPCDASKIESLLSKFQANQDFERCIMIRDYARKRGLIKELELTT